MKKIIKYFFLLFLLPFWHVQKLFPRNKKIWLFGAWYGQKYSDNSKYLFEYVTQNNPEIQAIWITKNKDVYEKLKKNNVRVYKAGTITSCFYTLRAGYCFSTCDTLDFDAFFLNGCKQVWLWHGMPLKTIGYEDDSYKALSAVKKLLLRIILPYLSLHVDYTISSASFFNGFLSKAFKLSDSELIKCGLPRCDAFFSQKKDTFITSIRNTYSSCKIVLYMPTFRMTGLAKGSRFNPFSAEFGFNEKEFARVLESKNIVFLYKPHFADSDIKVSVQSNRFMYISDNDYDDLYTVLNSVDALATDYSSVYFDFLASDKPAFLLPFDYDDYVHKSRSHFFNMYEHMNAPTFHNWPDFLIALQKDSWDVISKDEKMKFCEYIDGNSCRNIVEFIKQ